mmetsp:Transcript_17529/g.34463  ORF Transcript_17529/g.34463 Transcript_17529/m.34463 type:complete len:696 (+) Transcript_17529:169-2256(+)
MGRDLESLNSMPDSLPSSSSDTHSAQTQDRRADYTSDRADASGLDTSQTAPEALVVGSSVEDESDGKTGLDATESGAEAKMNDKEDTEDPNEDANAAWTTEDYKTGLGYLRDGLSAAVPAVDTGFNFARSGTDLGFWFGKTAASAPFEAARWLGVPATEGPQNALTSVLDFAHGITRASLDFSNDITRASLGASDGALELSGAERGQTVKSLREYVNGLRGVDDSFHTKDALLGLATLLGQLSGELTVKNPFKLMAGARALSEVQRERRMERLEKWRDSPESKSATQVPDLEVVDEWFRYSQFAAAAYGHHALHFLGIAGPGTSRWSMKGDKAAIRGVTGIPEDDIIILHQGSEMYRPGHFVAVSHISRKVIISIRGTMRPHDVLVDLVCEQEELVSMYDNEKVIEGRAHQGFMRSAQRLANDLHEPVVELLRSNPGYELVVTGHSLGAGVATLLTLLWARMPIFRDRNIRAFAYGSPCSVSHEIAQAPFTRKHITSIIVGDDIVSRLSLRSFQDLQRAMIAMAPASSVSKEEKSQIYASLERSKPEDKLYSAGRVYMLDSDEFGKEPLVEIDPVNILDAIELTESMFAIHLPNEYVRTLREMRLRAMGAPPSPNGKESVACKTYAVATCDGSDPTGNDEQVPEKINLGKIPVSADNSVAAVQEASNSEMDVDESPTYTVQAKHGPSEAARGGDT